MSDAIDSPVCPAVSSWRNRSLVSWMVACSTITSFHTNLLHHGMIVVGPDLGLVSDALTKDREARFQWSRALSLEPTPEDAEAIRSQATPSTR